MKPAILLIGKNGQIGADLLPLLPRLGEVVALGRAQLDLAKPDDVRRVIRDVRPRLIVNAAAYTAVDQAEDDEAAARAVNADTPRIMAEEAKKIGAALVHYSTDYVFDGSKRSPYEETDPTNPLNVYGRTKLAGEQAIQAVGAPHLIFRTAWVYATRGKNFVLTILQLATEREELRVVSDQTGSPAWSREIADATTRILERLADRDQNAFSFAGISGTYHMTAAGETNRCELARAIIEEARQAPPHLAWLAAATGGKPLIACRVTPITSAERPARAPRPAYSVLSNARLLRTFGFALPSWRDQLHSAFSDS
jgi:dTDP-4-dehydrorhamnose reductase